MNKSWSKIYNNKNFFRNIESLEVTKKFKNENWSAKKLSFKLFKIMNPTSNNVSLYKSYIQYMNFISDKIENKKNFSVLDYGSGNGSTLLYLQSKYKPKKIYSKDVNKHFINLQKKFLYHCNFEIIKPNKSKFREKNNSIDWILSNAVFHCLNSKKQAKDLILDMLRISKKGVFISDIFNKKFKDKFTNYQMERQNLTKKEYLIKYKKTQHLYFTKEDFFFLKKKNFSYKFINMPKSFYDSQFGRFSILIFK